jgi:hypothetical protein
MSLWHAPPASVIVETERGRAIETLLDFGCLACAGDGPPRDAQLPTLVDTRGFRLRGSKFLGLVLNTVFPFPARFELARVLVDPGSGDSVALWRPVPRPGFVALGVVARTGARCGTEPPEPTSVRTCAAFLARRGTGNGAGSGVAAVPLRDPVWAAGAAGRAWVDGPEQAPDLDPRGCDAFEGVPIDAWRGVFEIEER